MFSEKDEMLQDYKGVTPKPLDFNEFWQERMNEADNITLEYTIQQSDISSPACQFLDLYFKGIRGERLYAKYIRPHTDKRIPVVMQFHGYPGSSRSWFELATFAGMGYALVALDCPGQGGKSQDSGGYVGTTVSGHLVAGLDGEPKDMYYVKLYQNMRILMNIVKQLDGIDKDKIFVNGASQGGGLATVCAALHPIDIKKAVILYPFLSDFQKVYELDSDTVAYEGIRYYFRWFDPFGKRTSEIFTKMGYFDVHHFASSIKAEVMFGCSLSDQICPPLTQMAVYNNITSSKNIHYFPKYGHEEIPVFDDEILNFLGDNNE
ncbi:MAG: alpha/beta fold hydrolase [Coprobacillus sp.]